jgi:alkanesulfonate monooxygenase SsuD/methylene tetrahydromethanopterin reductase-like flavin-dependent oxidoreductase (luciferase family)
LAPILTVAPTPPVILDYAALRIGLHLHDRPIPEVRDLARAAEAAGCSHVFFPELSVVAPGPATGRDPFIAASVALESTSTLHVGTAVVATIFHTPHHLALAAATLAEQSGGRFVLGVGVAHREFAERLGVGFPESILRHANDACLELRRLASGGVAFSSGFPVWLAALGPGMVRTAIAAADGGILNWVTPAEAERVSRASTQLDRPWTLAAMVRVGRRQDLELDADRYRAMFANYGAHFARQGLGSAAEVVDATCMPVEEDDRLPTLVTAYADAGVDLLVLNPSRLDRRGIEKLLAGVAKVSG